MAIEIIASWEFPFFNSRVAEDYHVCRIENLSAVFAPQYC
jgi:hypothetical protein